MRLITLLLVAAAAVPTVTPNRRIVVTTRPVVVDMIVVTEQRGSGPAKTTITPAPPSATPPAAPVGSGATHLSPVSRHARRFERPLFSVTQQGLAEITDKAISGYFFLAPCFFQNPCAIMSAFEQYFCVFCPLHNFSNEGEYYALP